MSIVVLIMTIIAWFTVTTALTLSALLIGLTVKKIKAVA